MAFDPAAPGRKARFYCGANDAHSITVHRVHPGDRLVEAHGLRTVYGNAGYSFAATPFFANVLASVIYHDFFSADWIAADYGNEWDALVEAKLDENVTFGVKYAGYRNGRAVASLHLGSWGSKAGQPSDRQMPVRSFILPGAR